MKKTPNPDDRELLKLGAGALQAAKALAGSLDTPRQVRRHCHGTAEMCLKAFLVSRGMDLNDRKIRIHDLAKLNAECVRLDGSFAALSPDIAALARDYPPNAGSEGCETSVEAHYNPQDGSEGADPAPWLESAERIRAFVESKLSP